MSQHVPSNRDEPDLEARELAQAAVRRAGLSAEEWTAAVLSAKEARRLSPARERNPTGPEPIGTTSRHPGPVRPELERTFEALMKAVSAESERQTRDHASRTAIALESMASWIEQTEERLNETARASADHQDRIATALSQALSGLRSRLDSVERQATAERHMQSDKTCTAAIGAIRGEIERLRESMDHLATREQVVILDRALRGIAEGMEHGAPDKDLLILAQATAAVYREVQTLSENIDHGLHGRIESEIEHLKGKIDRIAETGIDRSVIEFLGSQIVDMRHDLSQRAEPRQIERLSEEVNTLGRQLADLRLHQVGRNDFSALKASLENVCAALNRTIAVQEASDVPSQLDSMSRDLAELASRSAPAPLNLDPITDQLALLTERMEGFSESRFQPSEALNDMIERLSSQIQAVADKEARSQDSLMKRFDRIEEELQQVGQQVDNASMEQMLRSIDEKLDRVPLKPLSLDLLEEQIASIAERLAQKSDEPLQKILDETTGHLRNLHNDAAGIAERAAKAALQSFQGNFPDAAGLDALKQGFVELKALQIRADRKTQETLRAVNGALETLASRLTEQGVPAHRPGSISHALRDRPPEQMAPADRLEAAVRRLHAVTLSQTEEVAATRHGPNAEPGSPGPVMDTADEADLGQVRASFIAAARRAAQADQIASSPNAVVEEQELAGMFEAYDEDEVSPASSVPLMERIRRTLDAHRRSLLFGLGLAILATGAAHVLSSGLVPSPLPLIGSGGAPQQSFVVEAHPLAEATETGSITAPADGARLFQPSSLATRADPAASRPAAAAAPKFLVDPATVGRIPALVPAALREAASAGDAAAIYEIASRASEGRGIPQDMALAAHLFERAAQAGLPPAQERLAMLLEKGIGTGRDTKQAVAWYERAAQSGNIRAMHNLATLLASGLNGKPDYASAFRWYSEAAEAGLKDSQFNAGVLLARGIGTRQDLVKAYQWLALAATQGDDDAAKKREELAGRLSAAELKAAQASIKQWRPRPADPVANEAPTPASGHTTALDITRDAGVDG
ncbi:tetratricopeptide repeat protein [Microvirga makkahensis]|uniref:Localization factor PodJL n=1 Tax=Microvirga makkahensis TaxID=1128670 RepID=A0A7X3MVB5_9HYPH|nr:tetratricopeptide repeat protein [Microvirga makkahensis]MXQ13785.1 hypothetical protein [Microvirga makkahensis]